MRFFTELKRRNVIRLGAAYLVASWVLLQVVDLVLEYIAAPTWVMQVFMLALGLGLPLVLIFAWVFEMTPEGLKKEKEIDPQASITPETGRKLDRITIVFLVIAVVFLLADRFSFTESPPAKSGAETPTGQSSKEPAASGQAAPPAEKSIAVLPFRDMSAARDQAYFGEGIAEELLNALVKLDGIRVASRTSAFSLAGRDLDIPAIAEGLGVNHILEGSVRTSGRQVRVTAQLIDVAEDTHLWSETYDGTLDDIFQIQDEITAKITAAMEVQLAGKQAMSPARDLTDNAEAYRLYLQGRHFWRQRNVPGLHRAVNLFRQAVERDPEFHQAWSNLAIAYVNLPDYDRSYDVGKSFDNALAAADRALALNPASTEARLIKATYAEFHCDTRSAAARYEAAIADDPDDPTARHWYAIVLLNTGHIERALEQIERAEQSDPLISAVLAIKAHALALLGRADESVAVARQAAALGFRGGTSELEGIVLIIAGDRSAGAVRILEASRAEENGWRRELLERFAAAVEDPSQLAAFTGFVGGAGKTHPYDTAEVSDLLALLGSPYLFEYFAGVECPVTGQLNWSPTFKAQRGGKQFFNLMQRTGSVAYWRDYGWPDDCTSLDPSLAECTP